jgi:hypothetical protein
MGNNVVCRFEPLDDLEAAWLLHEHTLARIVRVADSDHKAIRHLPNALALVECDRHKLPTRRIRAFADEIQPSLFNTLESPFIHLPAEDLGQRCLALELPFLIGFHNSSPPRACLKKPPANRRYTSTRSHGRTWRRSSMLPQGYAVHSPGTRARTVSRRAVLQTAESASRREKLPPPWDPLELMEAAVVERDA